MLCFDAFITTLHKIFTKTGLWVSSPQNRRYIPKTVCNHREGHISKKLRCMPFGLGFWIVHVASVLCRCRIPKWLLAMAIGLPTIPLSEPRKSFLPHEQTDPSKMSNITLPTR